MIATSENSTALLDWLKQSIRPEARASLPSLRIADLFCGCGGLSLGCWEAARRLNRKLDVRFAIDIEQDAASVYNANFPGNRCRTEDIQEYFHDGFTSRTSDREKKLQKSVGNLDILVAGPPCQGHSDLNNQSRRSDPRNKLYNFAARAIQILEPQLAIIENVPTVIHDKGQATEAASSLFQRIGYRVESGTISFMQFGLPQKRRRHILIAYNNQKLDFSSFFTNKPTSPVPLWPYIRDLAGTPTSSSCIMDRPGKSGPVNLARINYLFDNNLYDLPNSERPDCHANGHSYKSMYGRLSKLLPAQTMTTGFGSMGQGRFVHPTRRRLITPREAARIQGFPDFFSFQAASGVTSIRRLIGNAVPPILSTSLVTHALSGD